MKNLAKIKFFIGHYDKSIVTIVAIAYFVFFSLACLWKYYNFGYNALDLAIINQVFFNTANGNIFGLSIHPPTYLGDHFSPIIFLLLPFYYFFAKPETLLILQTLALTLCVWPIYLIAKQALGKNWAVFFALAWLINPFVQNINLFETSFLPYAVFLLLWTFYFYQKQKFIPFLIFAFLSLLVREDVALVILMFGPIAILEKRKIKWWLSAILISAFYFILALKITAFFSPSQNYKFLVYYSWLGQTPLEIIKNIIFKPYLPLFHLFSVGNWEMFLGFLLPFIFLPLIAPIYLLLAVLIFLQLAMGQSGGGQLILQTHYASLFLPAIFTAAIFSLKKIYLLAKPKEKLILTIKKYPDLAFLILISALFYSCLTLGPIIGLLKNFSQTGLIGSESQIKQNLIKQIPKNAAVCSGYDFLASLSSRKNLCSFNYAFLGSQQFLAKKYELPPETDYLVLNYNDLITYELQYKNNGLFGPQYQKANLAWPKNLAGFGLIDFKNNVGLYQKGKKNNYTLVEILDTLPATLQKKETAIDDNLEFLGFNKINQKYQFFWQSKANWPTSYRIIFSLKNNQTVITEKIYPLAYDLLNDNTELTNKKIQTNYWPELPKTAKKGKYNLKIQVVEIDSGGIEINEIRATKDIIDKKTLIGPEIDLGEIIF
ncbi:MAG: DUF2079 domain-containing protein [Candidatus Buchananbacteria bacterium]